MHLQRPAVLIVLAVALALLTACTPGAQETAAALPNATASATSTPPPTATASATSTVAPTATPSPEPDATPTATPTPAPTDTPAPTVEPTPIPTPSPHPAARVHFRADFAPDGAIMLADGSALLLFKDTRFVLVRADDGSPIAEINTPGDVNAFDLARDGTRLAVSSNRADGGVDLLIYALPSAALLQTIDAAPTGRVTIVRFTPDGSQLIGATSDFTVSRWQVADGARRHSFRAHSDIIHCLALAADGQTFVTGSYAMDKEIIVWALDGSRVATPSSNNRHCYQAAFSPDGRYLLFHSREKLSLIQTSDWSRIWFTDFTGTTSEVNFAAASAFTGFTPAGRLYLATRAGTLTLIDPASQTVVNTFELGALAGIAFAPNAAEIVVVRSNRVVELVPYSP